jgi:hypothetical protein
VRSLHILEFISSPTELITQCHCECNEVKRSNRKGLGLLLFVPFGNAKSERNDCKYFCPATYNPAFFLLSVSSAPLRFIKKEQLHFNTTAQKKYLDTFYLSTDPIITSILPRITTISATFIPRSKCGRIWRLLKSAARIFQRKGKTLSSPTR